MQPQISILVPVHNGGALIESLVKRVLDEQTYPPELIQLVIVDDASEDGAVDAVREKWAGDDRLVTVRAALRNIDASRNLARAHASGELLVTTDHDCLPDRDWLERGAAEIGRDEMLAGHVRFSHSAKPSVWELLDMSYHLDQRRYVTDGRAVTANLFIWSEMFDKLGGLNEWAGHSGDFEFVGRAVRAGVPLRYAPDVIVTHPTRNREQYLRKMRRMGRGEALIYEAPNRLILAFNLIPGSATLIRAVKHRKLGVLNIERLAEHGIRPSRWMRVMAVFAEVLVAGPALTRGRIDGLRDAKRAASSRPH